MTNKQRSKLAGKYHRALSRYIRQGKFTTYKGSYSKREVLDVFKEQALLGYLYKPDPTLSNDDQLIEIGRIVYPERMPPTGRQLQRMRINDVRGDSFLNSYAWKKLRYKALQLHGRRCKCCGATPEEGAVMNVDHIKPRKKYPELALDINNLQILCGTCNHGKGNWDETDWR